MGFQGFENFGAQFAPLADAQLKEAYNDYQAQKDLGAAQRQLGQDRLAAQEGAVKYGLESPLANRIPVDPTIAKQLGATAPQEGQDPLAHMQDFIGQLNKQYPGVVDDKGTVNPAVYGRLMEMRKIQQALEADAAKIAERNKSAMELANLKQKNALELEGVRSKNIAQRQREYETPQQRLIREQIKELSAASVDGFTDPDDKLQYNARIAELTSLYEQSGKSMGQPAQAPAKQAAPVAPKQAAPKAKGYISYDEALKKWGKQDSPALRKYYEDYTKGK